MIRKPIPLERFLVKPYHLWAKHWMVLTAGDFASGQFNSMAVGWGSFGAMWDRPFAQIVVRPVRYTYEFTERHDTFTLCAFPEEYRKAVALLGSKSGRDGDKISEAGLAPIASTQVAAPGFAEAELIIECRKIYIDDFDPTQFLDPQIEGFYPEKDYHRVYFGQILAVMAAASYGA